MAETAMQNSSAQIAVRFPDGATRTYTAPITPRAIAAMISKSLEKTALAAKIDGKLVDLGTEINSDIALEIITRKSPEALELIRHDAAHVMAEAVQALFPGTQVTIGPSIENGFYYDFYRETPFTTDDLARIEAKMHEIIKQNKPFTREEWSREDAVKFFEAKGEKFKVELIRDLPGNEVLSIYKQGEWLDLCRGPHLRSTGDVGAAFKLTKVAGAYWRGDSKREQLTRIYGTAWRDQAELDAYITMLEEAEKRDHRKLGREMDLFHFQEDAPGAVFWHPRGWTIFQQLVSYMRFRQECSGYVEVNTPDVMDRSLWEISGHWQNYRDHMFTTTTEDERIFALKPMNCPGGVSLFKHGMKSYRDLPIRMAEFGKVHRYEPSGALHGLLRVRHFTQDDAHIFCTPQQMDAECREVVALVLDIYRQFGFENISIKLSTRPENRMGDDETWDRLEGALIQALEHMKLEYRLNPGEGAFYGPKLEFVLRDAIGRDWQCGTLQVDMNLPERFQLEYVGEDGAKHRPVMLHRALFGSLERFTGILIENYAGKLPVWLMPVQAMVATITSDADDYAAQVLGALKAAGLRAETDLRNEKINYKVREHSVQKIPFILAVGKKEIEDGTVAVRRLGEEGQKVMPLAEAVALIASAAKVP